MVINFLSVFEIRQFFVLDSAAEPLRSESILLSDSPQSSILVNRIDRFNANTLHSA